MGFGDFAASRSGGGVDCDAIGGVRVVGVNA